MHVLVCPTAFKESLDVETVIEAMTAGVRRARPDASIEAMPLSDGGPGLLETLRAAMGGTFESHRVSGPLGGTVEATSLLLPDGTVVLEVASACGLHLMPPHLRDPLRAHTQGVGELLVACLEAGAREAAVGLGGSGTVDGGTGMARAIGFRFLDARGSDLEPGGGALRRLARIVPGRPPQADITAMADVCSPLLGPDGAARRFAPQKGATLEQVEMLEEGLARLAERMEEDLGLDVADLSGAGAAGGLGAGCVAFLGAELRQGPEWVLAATGFDAALARADLVITGEGAYDTTGELGKVVPEVVRRAVDRPVPVLLVCGRIEGKDRLPAGVQPVDAPGQWLAASDLEERVAAALG